jgi:dienelactone hydrolase
MPSAGPLEVMPAGSLTSMTYDYLTGQAQGVWNDVRDPRIAAIDTAGEVAAHAARVRAKVLERIGGLPSAGPGLNARFTGTLDRNGYKVDKLVYESQANFHVTANLYRPETGTPPFPTVVGIPGHATEGKAYPDYQKVWIALAKRGFNVLAIDPFGHGERFEHWDAANDRPLAGSSGTGEHTVAGTKMYLTGTNPVRWMAFDVMRGIDYLHTRPDVDADRIAVVGNSGGGDETNWLAALEPRLAAAGPSCGVNSGRRCGGRAAGSTTPSRTCTASSATASATPTSTPRSRPSRSRSSPPPRLQPDRRHTGGVRRDQDALLRPARGAWGGRVLRVRRPARLDQAAARGDGGVAREGAEEQHGGVHRARPVPDRAAAEPAVHPERPGPRHRGTRRRLLPTA